MRATTDGQQPTLFVKRVGRIFSTDFLDLLQEGLGRRAFHFTFDGEVSLDTRAGIAATGAAARHGVAAGVKRAAHGGQ